MPRSVAAELISGRPARNVATTMAAYFSGMTTSLLIRLRDWLLDSLTFDSEADAAGAMADATRWGWLPALSGVSIGAGHARSEHAGTVPETGGMSG